MHVEDSVIGSKVMGQTLFSSMAALRTRETRWGLVGFFRRVEFFCVAAGARTAGGAEGAGRARGAEEAVQK